MNCPLIIKMIALVCLCGIGGLTSCNTLPELPGIQILGIEDKQIEIFVQHREQAVYTLVFESGARNCVQSWEKVLQQLPDNVNVYAYSRPGYCKSSPAITERNSQNIVNELRQALHLQGLEPPYILIGHSMGGLYMQHFAREFPEEVQGLVLVDAMYPGFLKEPREFPWYAKMGMRFFISTTVREEINLAYTSGVMIDTLPAIDDKPIVRMFNEPKAITAKAMEVDFGVFNKDEHSLDKIRNMYPRAEIVVADSSHQMQDTSPELVVQAINDVMQVRGPLR